LGDDQWSAIQDAETRLDRAKSSHDDVLAVGCAKDLCECIAKVVIAERGSIVSSAADMPDVISAAHKCLEYQPGEGVATGPEVRKVAQGLKSVVLGLSEMRGRFGTGHGRPALPGTGEEHSELAYDAAMLWSGWALRRLEPYIAGDVTRLVRDLDGTTFRRGDLANRLLIANLPRLPAEDQKRLGIAVARRASGGTFVVGEDGIEAVKPDDAMWPEGYVQGLLAGMFLNKNGYLDISTWKVREAARLIAGSRSPVSVLDKLLNDAARAVVVYQSTTDGDVRRAIGLEIRSLAEVLPDDGSRARWIAFAGALEAEPVE
jgi:hypothetical protein